MKIILLFGFLFLNDVMCTEPVTKPTIGETTAYICDSSNAKKYHFKSTCRGLSNCQYKIVKTTVSTAKSKGLTVCGWEN